MNTTDHLARPTSARLIAGGAIAPILFTLVYLIEGATRPGYDPWRQTISALSLSNLGWMQIINFLVCGLLILGFAIGLRQNLNHSPGATMGPILIGIVGVGFILAGIFKTDPSLGYPPGTPPGPSVHTTLHGFLHALLGGLVVFSGLPAACFVLARRWTSIPYGKGWPIYSIASGLMMIACFIEFTIASMHDGPAGLFERLSLTVGFVWLTYLAFRVLGMRNLTR